MVTFFCSNVLLNALLAEEFSVLSVDSGPVKVNQKMVVFGFEILCLKPRIFSGLNPSFKASKSGFELYSAICNC